MTDGSGLRQLGLFEHLDPLGCSLKTRVRLCCMDSTGLSLNWKERATTSSPKDGTGGTPLSVLVLTTLGRRTDESGCGLSRDWKTPQAHDERKQGASRLIVNGRIQTHDGDSVSVNLATQAAIDWQTPSATCADAGATSRSGDRKDELLLGGQVRQWATPKAEERQQQNSGDDYAALSKQVTQPENWGTPRVTANGGRGASRENDRSRLEDQAVTAENWPTATARDYRSPCASEATHDKNSRPLSEVVGQQDQANHSTPGKPRGSLNSAWVMQLMGFPDEYAAELTRLCCEWSETHGATPSRK